MSCPRCKGLGILLNKKATDLLACVAEPIAAFVPCNWCHGSGTLNNADLAGAGIAEGGGREIEIVATVTALGHPLHLPAPIAAQRIDIGARA